MIRALGYYSLVVFIVGVIVGVWITRTYYGA